MTAEEELVEARLSNQAVHVTAARLRFCMS
jgi:hypothetical protein